MKASHAVLFGFATLFLSSNSRAELVYPCNGASGVFRTNPDSSPGGFVADTAVVDTSIVTSIETQICERATVIEGVTLEGRVKISGRSTVRGKVLISDYAEVSGEAYIINPYGENLVVSDNSRIYGNAFLQGTVTVSGSSEVFGWGKVLEFAEVTGSSKVCGNKVVKGHTVLEDDSTNCAQ